MNINILKYKKKGNTKSYRSSDRICVLIVIVLLAHSYSHSLTFYCLFPLCNIATAACTKRLSSSQTQLSTDSSLHTEYSVRAHNSTIYRKVKGYTINIFFVNTEY